MDWDWDWETLVEDYMKRFMEKGIHEGVARAMAEMLADEDIQFLRIWKAQHLDVASNDFLQEISAPNEESKQ